MQEQETTKNLLKVWETLPIEAQNEILKIVEKHSKGGMKATTSFRPLNGYKTVHAQPVPRAPRNVFLFKSHEDKILGWRNVFELPVEYDIEVVHNKLFSVDCKALATRMMPENGPRRRFLVIGKIMEDYRHKVNKGPHYLLGWSTKRHDSYVPWSDEAVHKLYGERIEKYFAHHQIQTHVVILPGEEYNKKYEAVDRILENLVEFGLHRREPLIGIGGGVLLDIVGLAANLYRRGVPYIRVPTTLLALVDASVGVKNGVDYYSICKGPQKNRVGSFYAPSHVFLDKSFVATQDERNIVNGLGEIMKLALVRSTRLFELLEAHGRRLVEEKFQGDDGVADEVIELSIQIMLEELGPNLWEKKLERCVDFGHTFSKIIEMQPEPYTMHGEAVNIDGFFCVILSMFRGFITQDDLHRIFYTMKEIGLPTWSEHCTKDVMVQGLKDAVEHRHGQQRIPLVNKIGSAICVSDITEEEVERALDYGMRLHRME